MYTTARLASMGKAIERKLGYWAMPEGSHVTLLTASENATFLASSPGNGRRIILRVHRPNYHTRSEIQSELAWISALLQSGSVSTPSPLAGLDGEYLGEIEADGSTFFVVAFQFVEGREPNVGESLPEWFQRLGAVTASLHEHSRQWQSPDWFARKRWDLQTMIGASGYWGDWRAAEGLSGSEERLILEATSRIEDRLHSYGQGVDRYGLVHADLRLANLLVSGDSLEIIDFDDCGFCWFAFDFAAAISFYELDPMIPELKRAWIAGYRTVADLDRKDEDEMGTFVMLRRIMLTAWLASHADSDPAKELGEGYVKGTATLAGQYLRGTLCA